MPEVNINYLAVIVAAVVNMAVGAVWYSRSVFGTAWAQAIGKKIEDMSGGGYGYAWAALGSLVTAFFLANLVGVFQETTFVGGLGCGFIVWLGFVLPTMGINALFEGKDKKLIAINAGYPLVGLALMGAILAVWA